MMRRDKLISSSISTQHGTLSREEWSCHFLPYWYKLLPDWLKYSPTKHCAFCLPCYLSTKTTKRASSSAFTSEGFSSWKNVNSGKDRDFLSHVGEGPNSLQRHAVQILLDLSNQVHTLRK